MDEVYIVSTRGERRYLWHVVDQGGDVLDNLVQKRKDKHAAVRFFKKLKKGQGCSAREIVTDNLTRYGAVRKVVMSTSMHCDDRYVNNRTEVSHEHTHEHRNDRCGDFNLLDRPKNSWLFTIRSITFFCLGRHLPCATNYRMLRSRSSQTWQQVTCIY